MALKSSILTVFRRIHKELFVTPEKSWGATHRILRVAPRRSFALSSADDFVARGSAECSHHRIHRHSSCLTFVRSLAPARSTPLGRNTNKKHPTSWVGMWKYALGNRTTRPPAGGLRSIGLPPSSPRRLVHPKRANRCFPDPFPVRFL